MQLSVQLHLENMLHIHILFHAHAGIFNAQLEIRYSQMSSQQRPGPGKSLWQLLWCGHSPRGHSLAAHTKHRWCL